MIHEEAVDPTCTSKGHREYWYCDRCHGYCQSEDSTAPTFEWDEITIAALAHNYLVRDPGFEPTCTEDGVLDHMHCNNCGKNFEDSSCSVELESIVDPAFGHSMEEHAAVEATCTMAGNVEYWTCDHEDGTVYYADAGGSKILADIVVKATGHKLTHYAAVEGGCKGNGNIEYWYCSACELYFNDPACGEENEISQAETVVRGGKHTLVYHAEEAPKSCTENGTKEHWYCSECGLNFSDENGENELTDLTILAKHNLTHHEAVAATCTEAGNVEYWSCSVCGKFFADAQGQEPLETVETPASGHKLTHHAEVDATCEKAGNVEYWSCSECGKNFDASEANELVSVGTPITEHTLVHHEATETTAEYWECSECGVLFADAAGTAELAEIPVVEEEHAAEIAGLSVGGAAVAGLGIGLAVAVKRKRRIL